MTSWPWLDDLARVLDVVVGELGDVDEALDAVEDLDERAEGDDLGDLALELVADVVGVETRCHGSSWVCLRPSEMRWRSRSMSSTLTGTTSPIERISEGWLTWLQESSEMWIRPSMPSRSTNAPKSTMFEIAPSTTCAGLQAVEDLLADLLALLLEHRAAREDDVVARAVELDHLALDLLAEELVEVLHAADVDQRGRQEAAHAEVDDEAALDDLDDRALDRLARLGGGLDAAPGLLEAGALLGQDQAAVLVLLGEDESVDLLADLDLVGGVDRLADRQLVERDDPFGLVADVDEDLVLVDADDLPVTTSPSSKSTIVAS